jgi:RNA polymerase sigma-70 factor, ECF subfamily
MSASRVTSGPGDRQLEPYRRELTGYCYRMLGSIHDAEDAVQDTMLRAWRALPTFEDRVGLRPWLYRIATNVCLDLLKSRSRRALPVEVVPAATGELVRGDRRPEATWVEPAPDRLILPDAADPAERAVLRESVRLAFIAALQHLAPRQRAVLILRDMLQWRAAELARLLDTSVDAVNSTLRRARASIPEVDRRAARVEPTEADLNLLAAYIDAFEHHDVDALVKLRRDDAILEMPPFELWMQGPHDIRRWLLAVDALGQEHLTPVNANGAPAVGVYRPLAPGEAPKAFSIQVLDVISGRISAIHAFLDPRLFERFNLPGEIAV